MLTGFYRKQTLGLFPCLLSLINAKFISKIQRYYLKCRGFDNQEIRFMQMIWKAKVRGRIHLHLRKYQK